METENLFKFSWSVKMATMPIYGKTVKNQNQESFKAKDI